jgi:Protein of unknown function (DUF3593).
MLSKDTLFAISLFPYLGFLWFLTRSGQMPRLALIGFYGTLVFVAVTIPAGIYAKVVYHEALANIDWLHGDFYRLYYRSFIVRGLCDLFPKSITTCLQLQTSVFFYK